jgi:hypothetical protein
MGNTITESLLKAGKIYNKIVIISAGTLKISEDDLPPYFKGSLE